MLFITQYTRLHHRVGPSTSVPYLIAHNILYFHNITSVILHCGCYRFCCVFLLLLLLLSLHYIININEMDNLRTPKGVFI